jgi:hypothetical protein
LSAITYFQPDTSNITYPNVHTNATNPIHTAMFPMVGIQIFGVEFTEEINEARTDELTLKYVRKVVLF